MPGTRHWI